MLEQCVLRREYSSIKERLEASRQSITHDTFTLKDEYMNDTLVIIAEGNTDTIVGNSTNADKHFPYDYHLALEDNGVPHLFFTYQGGHDGSVYKKGMYNFFRRIFHEAKQ